MTPSVALALELPHDRAAVALARHLTREALAAIDVAGDVIDDIVLALSEACANVLRHVTPSSYEVRVVVRDHRCDVQVADRGQGLDVEAVRRGRPAPEAERGRGLAIMEGVMDRVEVLSEPGRGTRVTLVKRLAFIPGSEAAELLRRAMPEP